jgi:uncharacterized protein
MRFLVLCIVLYVGFRALKALVVPGKPSVRHEESPTSAGVDDIMVKDPFCQTYFPARRGIKKVIKGETLYFCSEACRDKYVEEVKRSKG